MKKILISIGILVTSLFLVFISGIYKGFLTSIEVNQNSVDNYYRIGNFEYNEIEVILVYSNGFKDKIPLHESMLNANEINGLSDIGEHILTVTYKEFSTTFTVTLVEDFGPYTVSFYDQTSKFIGTRFVEIGQSAVAPSYEAPYGYEFSGWDKDVSRVISNLIVKATISPITFDIIYDLNQGTNALNNPNTYTIENNTIQLEPAIKEGYTFIGWYDFTNQVINEIPKGTTGDLFLRAIFEPTIFQLSYETDGGSPLSSTSYAYLSFINEPEIPIKEGYSFGGWFLDETFDLPFSFDKMPSFNVTLYAKWIVNDYYLSFDSLGGSLINPKKITFGDSIFTQETPIKEGYSFLGWYLDSNGEYPFTATVMGAQSLTLYAKWSINSYTISFNSNGGSFVESISEDYSSEITAPLSPTKEGYAFGGWYLDEGFALRYTFVTMPSQNTILFARWLINPYTITFDSLGGSNVDPLTEDYLTPLIEPEPPLRTGYTFEGWYLDQLYHESFAFSTMPSMNTTLYAKWSINSYTLSFNPLGGSSIPSQEISFKGNLLLSTIPTRTGYTFDKWTLDEEGIILLDFIEMPAHSMTLYAQWKRNSYLLSFDTDGGESLSSKEVLFEESLNIPTDLIKLGYTFGGWYLDESLATPLTMTRMPATSLMIYAKWNINSYTISFETNGGSMVSSITQDYLSTLALPQPTKLGYSFGGWYLSNSFDNPNTYSTMPSEDLTLFAQWNVNQYTLSFNSLGGTGVSSITQDYLSEVTAPSNPTRTGYSFSGWYYEATLVTPYVWGTMPATNLTLNAKWTVNSYTISFDSKGGNEVTSLTAPYGTTLTAPTPPTKLGYNFAGWYTTAAYQTAFTWSTMGASDITLYAKWTPKYYIISFITQSPTTITSGSFAYALPVTKPIPPTKEGYTFSGWTTDREGLNPFNWSSMPAENVTLYGQWSINSYTITYVLNGGEGLEEQTYNFQEIIELPEPIKEGFNFAGWYSDNTLTAEWALLTMPASNKTAYAKWLINSYTITLNLNGGIGKSSIVEVFETPITEPLVTKTGYSLDGWYLESNFITKYNFSTMPAENLSLFAKWTINSYTLTFESNQGSRVTAITQNYQSNVTKPLDPSRIGYDFGGWFVDETLALEYSFTTMPATDLTLYAKWTLQTYTLTFNTLGGNPIPSQELDYNTDLSDLKIPQREGYAFLGWTLDEVGATPNPYMTMPNEDVNLFAQWDLDQFTLSFNSNGGSYVSSITQDYLSEINEPEDPAREGYTFVGWYEEEDLENPYSFATMEASDRTLYAKWTINSYTISYGVNGGSLISNSILNYGETIELPSAPTYRGYTFVGWYTDEDLTQSFSHSVMPATDLTLYAKWSINAYTLTFDSQGGSAVNAITQNYLTSLTEPLSPTRTGYTFGGWYSDKTYTSSYSFSTMPADNHTIYAQWTINSYTLTFNSQGGSNVNAITQVYNTVVSAPNAPLKTGYTFVQWTTDQLGTQPYSFSKMPGQSLTLYAQWTINAYSITYVSNGGSAINSQSLNYGTTIQLPTTPTRVGYTFAGWYRDSALSSSMDLTTMPDYAFTLYAKWNLNSYTITFNSNGGSPVTSLTQYYGTNVTKPSDPTQLGYTFAGWYADSNLTQSYSFSTMPPMNTTLYAQWTANSYTITYESNGGTSISTVTKPYLSSISAPTSPTKIGYSFGGWFKDANLTQSYSFTTMPAQNLTLYAKWSLNSYTITFNSNGGSSVTAITQVYNSVLSAPSSPTRIGHTFAGWYSDVNLTQAYTFTSIPAQNLTLYAKWNVISYTLSYESNGGTSISSASIPYNSVLSAPTTPLKSGYRFVGWYSDILLTTSYAFTTMPAQNLTLYARWIHVASENALIDLKEAIDASTSLYIPYYAVSMPVWSSKWIDLQAATDTAINQYASKKALVESGATLTLAQQSDLNVLVIQIQDLVYQYQNLLDVEDSLGYRNDALGKGFEATINDQSLSESGGERMRLYFDQDSKTVYFLMSQDLQNQNVIAGIFGLGLKGGMFNFLSSENLYEFKSGNDTLSLYKADGTKKTDTEIQNEAQNLALEWIDMSQWDIIVKGIKFNTFNYLTIQTTFVLMMDDNTDVTLRTKFSTNYTFKFLPVSVATFDPDRYYYVGTNETVSSYSLTEAKTSFVNEINVTYNALNPASFTVEEWAAITAAKNVGIVEINKVSSTSQIPWKTLILAKQGTLQALYNLTH